MSNKFIKKEMTEMDHNRLEIFLIVSEFLTFCSKEKDPGFEINESYNDEKKFKRLQVMFRKFAKYYTQDMKW